MSKVFAIQQADSSSSFVIADNEKDAVYAAFKGAALVVGDVVGADVIHPTAGFVCPLKNFQLVTGIRGRKSAVWR